MSSNKLKYKEHPLFSILKVRINSIKYKLNYNLAKYGYRSKMYVKEYTKHDNFTKAKEHQWECDKYECTFSKYPILKEHKMERHSY